MAASQGEWRPDPAGRHEYRYWDGSKWTDQVSDRGQVTAEPYDGTVAAPPAPAATQTIVVRKGHGCLWALLIAAVVGIGVIVIVALAVNNAVDELNKEQARHAITKTQFDAVPLGITHADLESQLGKPPEDTQEFVTKGILDEKDINSSCVYYNEVGESFGSRFQFCFDGDSLRSKNAY
jgi:hypothetical protein